MSAVERVEVALVVVRAASPFLPRSVLADREAAALRAAGEIARRVDVLRAGEDLRGRAAATGARVIVTWRTADLLGAGPAGAAGFASLLADGIACFEVRAGAAVRVDLAQTLAAHAESWGNSREARQTHAAMTRRGRRQVAREGRWLGGRTPLGWRAGADGRIVLDLTAAAHIRAATRDVAAGRGAGAVAAQWNASGFTTTGGRPWTAGSARRVLLRARNAGLSEYRGEIVGRSVLPAIVTAAEWRAAVTALCRTSRQRSTA